MQPKTLSLTRLLLLSGASAGPLFILTVLIQDYTRPGFNPRLQPLSLLSLGTWGWVQIVNFVLTGVLNLLYAGGLWRRLHPGRAGTWGPGLIGAYGLGLMAVGVFRTDPAHGFPPGVPASTHPSWHGAIHALGGLFIFIVLAAALTVFGRLFLAQKERRWASYCLVSAVLLLLLFFGSFLDAALMARLLRLATAIGWLAVSMIAIKLLGTPDPKERTREYSRYPSPSLAQVSPRGEPLGAVLANNQNHEPLDGKPMPRFPVSLVRPCQMPLRRRSE